jgi:mono/diheme cytochrome c family protein
VAAVALVGWDRSWRSRPASPSSAADPAASTAEASGQALYTVFCETCHGAEGRGDGIAAPFCRVPPADFTRAEFKVRSTPSGHLPTDRDLRDMIVRGAGGDGAMPRFDFLSEQDVDRLVERIKTFSPRWRQDAAPAEIVLPGRVEGDAARGRQVYRTWGCAVCHGDAGEGDGPRAAGLQDARGRPERPTDLTRPRTFKGASDEPGLMRSVLTGFNGTTMPGFGAPPNSDANLWDLAAFMRSLQKPAPVASSAPVDTSTAASYWTTPVPEQGPDVSSVSCSACHAAQFRDWSGAGHAIAMSPGVWAQMNDQPELSGMCLSCHAPLRDQWNDDYLMADGVSCAACHARARHTFGPPKRPTTIAPLVSTYAASHGPTTTKDFFESADFCARCHQFVEGRAPKVNGAFLQNTHEEWRASRASREGKTCQQCHMPDRRHLFRGIHDPETVRGGVRWSFDATADGNRVESRMTLTNTETGHAFPTYIVPEVWMRIHLVDRTGRGRIVSEKLIGRQVAFENGQWRELGDTRLRQDETATLTYVGALPPGTLAVVGDVVVRPDAYHERSLATHLRNTRSDASRRRFTQALTEMQQSTYVLFRDVRELPK